MAVAEADLDRHEGQLSGRPRTLPRCQNRRVSDAAATGVGPRGGPQGLGRGHQGRQAPCHFGYAGPFAEAYLLGNIALRIGHRIEWDALAFRITNCREANPYLRRDYRRGWDLRDVAGSAYDPV